MLDENAGEKTNEICRMEKDIIFIKRHTVVDSRCKMVSPHSVLSTHMFLLRTILLFTTLEQRLCRISAIEVKQEDRKGRLTGCNLLVFQIDKFLESKDYDLRRVLWVDCISYETAVSHTARNRSSRVPCHDHRSYLTERTVLHIFTLHPRLCFNVSTASKNRVRD